MLSAPSNDGPHLRHVLVLVRPKRITRPSVGECGNVCSGIPAIASDRDSAVIGLLEARNLQMGLHDGSSDDPSADTDPPSESQTGSIRRRNVEEGTYTAELRTQGIKKDVVGTVWVPLALPLLLPIGHGARRARRLHCAACAYPITLRHRSTTSPGHRSPVGDCAPWLGNEKQPRTD